MNDNVKQFSFYYYSNVRSNLKNTFDADLHKVPKQFYSK